MDAMDDILAGLLSEDENQEFRFHSTMRNDDANINELHEEFNVAAEFFHSEVPDPAVSNSHPNTPGFFCNSALFSNVDWSSEGSHLDFSSPSRHLKSTKERTISALYTRNQEPPISCSVPMRSQEGGGLHVFGCERYTLKSSGCEEQNDLNITGTCSGFQPNCFEKLDDEFLDVGTKCRDKDDLNPATFMTASSNSQIEPSSQSRFTSLESSLHRRDQTQGSYEQQSHSNVENFSSESSRFAHFFGIPAATSVPNQALKLEQSAVPSQPSQNICNDPTSVSGNQYTWEFGTYEDHGLVESFPDPTSQSSSPLQFSPSPNLTNTGMSLRGQLDQTLSRVPFEPQKTKIDPNLQKKDKISQPTILESVSDPVSSQIKDLRYRSSLGSETTSFHIKCSDLEETPKLCGQNCYLCKRDLAVKPKGSYRVTKNLPTVAVLHCSHAFHDLCLEGITPQSQAHDPPCIPCAIGHF